MVRIKKTYYKKVEKKKLTQIGKELVSSKLNFLFYDAHEKLTPFDRKFIASLKKQFSSNPALSIKQLNKLDEIYFRVESRYQVENTMNDRPLSQILSGSLPNQLVKPK